MAASSLCWLEVGQTWPRSTVPCTIVPCSTPVRPRMDLGMPQGTTPGRARTDNSGCVGVPGAWSVDRAALLKKRCAANLIPLPMIAHTWPKSHEVELNAVRIRPTFGADCLPTSVELRPRAVGIELRFGRQVSSGGRAWKGFFGWVSAPGAPSLGRGEWRVGSKAWRVRSAPPRSHVHPAATSAGGRRVRACAAPRRRRRCARRQPRQLETSPSKLVALPLAELTPPTASAPKAWRVW